MPNQFSFLLREAFRGLRADRFLSLTSAITLGVCSGVMAILLLALAAVFSLDNLGTGSDAPLRAFTRPEFEDSASIARLRLQLEKLGDFDSVVFVSKDDALQEFRSEFGNEMLQYLEVNPLPYSFKLYPSEKPLSAARVKALAATIGDFEEVEEISSNAAYLQWLDRWRLPVQAGALILLGFMGGALALIVHNAIKISLYARRALVENMKYCGASELFILTPFVLEGLLLGLCGSLAGVAVLFGLKQLGEFLFSTPPLQISFARLSAELVGGVMVLSFFSSWRTVRAFFPDARGMIALLAAALIAAAPARDMDREITRQRQELDALRTQLETGQRELSALKAKKSVTVEELQHLSANIALTDEYLQKLESMDRQLVASADATQQELHGIQNRLDARSAVMGRRVRLLFMLGPPEKMLFGAPTEEGGFLRRVYWVKRLVRYDRRLMGESRQDMGRKRDDLERLEAKRQDLEAFRQRKREEMDRFTRARADQEQTLRALQQSESVKAETLAKLRENTRRLTQIIAALEKRRREEQARNPNRKPRELETGTRYCVPVAGPVVSRYGAEYNALLGTSTRNLGIEIEAPSGSSVRAAVSGEVALITRIPGYGQGVILDNGSGYFTLYANLSDIRVAAGDKVKTCQDIASEAADPGRVYFEVRKGTETLDPEAWLKGAERQ